MWSHCVCSTYRSTNDRETERMGSGGPVSTTYTKPCHPLSVFQYEMSMLSKTVYVVLCGLTLCTATCSFHSYESGHTKPSHVSVNASLGEMLGWGGPMWEGSALSFPSHFDAGPGVSKAEGHPRRGGSKLHPSGCVFQPPGCHPRGGTARRNSRRGLAAPSPASWEGQPVAYHPQRRLPDLRAVCDGGRRREAGPASAFARLASAEADPVVEISPRSKTEEGLSLFLRSENSCHANKAKSNDGCTITLLSPFLANNLCSAEEDSAHLAYCQSGEESDLYWCKTFSQAPGGGEGGREGWGGG